MRRATPTQQQFGAVISERAPESKDLAATQELEKFLKAMGLYEDDEGYRRRKVRPVMCPARYSCTAVECKFAL